MLGTLRRWGRQRAERRKQEWNQFLRRSMEQYALKDNPHVIDVEFVCPEKTDEEIVRPPILTLPPPVYWLSNSGVRHNSACGWYQNCKGRETTKQEGRPCKICGGYT